MSAEAKFCPVIVVSAGIEVNVYSTGFDTIHEPVNAESMKCEY